MIFCLRVYLFLTYLFIYWVWIITMIGYFSSCVYSAVGIDVSITVVEFSGFVLEQWCFQISINFVVRNVSDYFWIYCIGPCLISDWPWYLRTFRNNLLLHWRFYLMTCMMVSWSACLVFLVLGDRLFLHKFLCLVLGIHWFYLICLVAPPSPPLLPAAGGAVYISVVVNFPF